MVSKTVADTIRHWHAKGYNAREIAQVSKLPEQLVEAIINQPKTAEEWKRTIFSNHH